MAVLTACAPAGEPSGVEAPDSIPTPFSNEEEAFRAADATYRAYVDALNQVDLADPATFEHVYEWLTGEALRASQRSFSRMHANGLNVEGITRVQNIQPRQMGKGGLEIDVCLDVAGVEVRDANGQSAVASSRNEEQPLRISLIEGGTRTGMSISHSAATTGSICG